VASGTIQYVIAVAITVFDPARFSADVLIRALNEYADE